MAPFIKDDFQCRGEKHHYVARPNNVIFYANKVFTYMTKRKYVYTYVYFNVCLIPSSLKLKRDT